MSERSSTGSTRSSTGGSIESATSDRVSDPTILDTIEKFTNEAESKAAQEYAARFKTMGTQVAHSSFMDKIVEQVASRKQKTSERKPFVPDTSLSEIETFIRRAEAGESIPLTRLQVIDMLMTESGSNDDDTLDNIITNIVPENKGNDYVLFLDKDDTLTFFPRFELETGDFANPQ